MGVPGKAFNVIVALAQVEFATVIILVLEGHNGTLVVGSEEWELRSS